MKTTTSKRLSQIMSEQHLKQVDILDKAKPICEKYGVKLSKSDLSQYVSGKVEPGQDKLAVLGAALNISEAWLMGYDVPMEKSSAGSSCDSQSLSTAAQLTDEEALLIQRYRELNAEGQEKLLDYADDLAASGRYKKDIEALHGKAE